MSECTGRLPEFQECMGGLPDLFLHYLSCSFVYHDKFWHKKASECTGGIPVVHDWNILNHESTHQRYFVEPSPEGSTRGRNFFKYPTNSLWQNMCPISCDQCKQNSHACNQTLSSTHHFLISAWHSFSLQLSESVGIRCSSKVIVSSDDNMVRTKQTAQVYWW